MPWPQQQLGFDRAWPLTRGGGVTVAVVDTGVDGASPQLAGGRVLPGIDVTGRAGGRADSDCQGHGTFVAGIVAAARAPGSGFSGVAPEVTVLPVRVTDTAEEDGGLTVTALAAGIRAAVDGGAEVINVSASTDAPDPALAAAVGYAAARDVVVVASAANGARTGDPVTYPASYPSVLAVGAVDAGGKHADFSQTGSFVDLVAPGVSVVSIGPGGPAQWQGSGTSYAAPFVAGAAALVRSYHPQLGAAEVVHRLEATADRPAGPLPDPALGWGLVNPSAAVTAILPEERGEAPARMVDPPQARSAPAPPAAGVGPVLAVVGGLAALLVVIGAVLAHGLGRAAGRRGWRPVRVVEVDPGPRG